MDSPPPLGSPTDSSAPQVGKREGELLKTEMRSSKLVRKKHQNLEAKMILKKMKRVKKSMAEKAARMRAETGSLRAEMEEMVAAAAEKEKQVKLQKEKLDEILGDILDMSETEQVLMEILFAIGGNY